MDERLIIASFQVEWLDGEPDSVIIRTARIVCDCKDIGIFPQYLAININLRA